MELTKEVEKVIEDLLKEYSGRNGAVHRMESTVRAFAEELVSKIPPYLGEGPFRFGQKVMYEGDEFYFLGEQQRDEDYRFLICINRQNPVDVLHSVFICARLEELSIPESPETVLHREILSAITHAMPVSMEDVGADDWSNAAGSVIAWLKSEGGRKAVEELK